METGKALLKGEKVTLLPPLNLKDGDACLMISTCNAAIIISKETVEKIVMPASEKISSTKNGAHFLRHIFMHMLELEIKNNSFYISEKMAEHFGVEKLDVIINDDNIMLYPENGERAETTTLDIFKQICKE